MSNEFCLKNHFLVAMPALLDQHFFHSVVYVCQHNDDGAMGLVINKPTDINIKELLDHVQIAYPQDDLDLLTQPVLSGGPLQQERGFILHRVSGSWQSSMDVTEELALTTSRDILEAMAENVAPEEFLVTLGYASWEAGQLEQEMMNNHWISLPATLEILFRTPIHMRWQAAAQLLGVDMFKISGEAGHA